jgi:hypothetical protein
MGNTTKGVKAVTLHHRTTKTGPDQTARHFRRKASKTQPPCSICGKPIDIQRFPKGGEWAGGHNAEPVNDGRCCSFCNDTVVIRRRLRDLGYK